MKKTLLTLFAIVPLGAAMVVLQSCAGQGGPTAAVGGTTTSPTAAFLALQPAAQSGATFIGANACGATSCHPGELTDWKTTNHFANNITCERCHGPGSAHAANPGTVTIQQDPTQANILAFPKISDPVVCAQCHGPIYSDYMTSKHAEIIDEGGKGPSVSTSTANLCVSCHNGLSRPMTFDARTPVMAPGSALVTQIANYGNTATYPDAHTANCDTCHNPHKKTGNMDWNGADNQVRHALSNTTDLAQIWDTTYPQTQPDTVQFQTLNQVCGQCHNGRGTDFSDTNLLRVGGRPPMHHNDQFNMLLGVQGVPIYTANTKDAPVITFAKNTMAHADIDGQCSHCHMPNGKHTWTPSYDASCAPCHTAAGAAAAVDSVKNSVINDLTTLSTRLAAWAQTKTQAANPALAWSPDSWMPTSVIPKGEYVPTSTEEAALPLSILRARYNYFYIVIDNSYGVHNHVYEQDLIQSANANLDLDASVPAVVVSPSLTLAQKKDAINRTLTLLKQADYTDGGEH